MEGVDTAKFKPYAAISRQKVAVLLERYYKAKGIESNPSCERATYTDEKDIASWAIDAVIWCQANGLMGGDEQGKFNPTQKCNRAEAVAVLSRIER